MSRHALSSEFVDALVAARVSACAMRIALTVARMQGRNADAWPTMGTLAKRAGCDLRTAQRAIAELKSAGLVEVEERRGHGHRFSILTPGADAAPVSAAAPVADAAPTPGVSVTPPPAFSSPGGDNFVASHLSLEIDQGSQIRGSRAHAREAPSPSASDSFGRKLETIRAAFVEGFLSTGEHASPWILSLTGAHWQDVAGWLAASTPGREPETARQLGRGFALSKFARSRGYRFRGSGGLIEGPGEFLALAGGVAPSAIVHTETSDEDFEKAMGA